jgi:hypothetical protein
VRPNSNWQISSGKHDLIVTHAFSPRLSKFHRFCSNILKFKTTQISITSNIPPRNATIVNKPHELRGVC